MATRDAECGHEQHGRGVVETGLGLQRTGQAPRQRDVAQYGEDGRGIGRCGDGADEQGELPVPAERHVRDRRQAEHRHEGPDGRQREPHGHHRADLCPPGAQTPLGEDDDEGGEAERLREFGVVEPEVADAVLPQQEPEAEVDQQAGEPDADGQPDGDHGGEQHDGADEQDDAEILDRHLRLLGASHVARPDERRRPAPMKVVGTGPLGGGGGIRTRGELPLTRFRGALLRPLGHATAGKVTGLRGPAQNPPGRRDRPMRPGRAGDAAPRRTPGAWPNCRPPARRR